MSERETDVGMTRRQFVRAGVFGLASAAIGGAVALAPKPAPEDEGEVRLDVQRKEFEAAARHPRFL